MKNLLKKILAILYAEIVELFIKLQDHHLKNMRLFIVIQNHQTIGPKFFILQLQKLEEVKFLNQELTGLLYYAMNSN